MKRNWKKIIFVLEGLDCNFFLFLPPNLIVINFLTLLYLLEILRVTGKGDSLNPGRSSENDLSDESEKKPRYRTYAGGTVTEEVVKLSEKVVVPVKEYPKVNVFYSTFFNSRTFQQFSCTVMLNLYLSANLGS